MLVVIFAIRLPESVAHELPTTIAECNKMDQKKKPSFPCKIKSDEMDEKCDEVKDDDSGEDPDKIKRTVRL